MQIKTTMWYHYISTAAAAAKSLQSCLTLCDPIDGSPPGSTVPGILQARTLEWVAISFSNAGKWKVKVKSLSLVRLLATPWTAAYQAPLSMGFSRQEYWSGVPSPSPINRYTFVQIAFLVTFRVVRVVVSPVVKRILKDQRSKHFLSGLSSSDCVCVRDGHMGAKSTGLWAPVLNSIQQVISSY